MSDTHSHGKPSDIDLPDPGDLIALLRSVQTDLAGMSDNSREAAEARLDQVAEGVAALAEALDKQRAYSAHLKQHYVDCEASTSYRIGHAVVRVGRAPQRLVASLRSSRP